MDGERDVVSLTLKVEGCDECPFMKSERHYTADSFEWVSNWKCLKNSLMKIATVDRGDETPPVPQWCPLR